MAGTTRKRLVLLLAATAALVALGVGIAYAGEDVSADPVCCRYLHPSTPYFSDQGETASFVNPASADSSHNVTAKLKGPDGKPLFRSKTIGAARSTDIAGLKYLSGGSYKFFCTIHGPSMSGTYVVDDVKGTPVARPKIDVTVPQQSLNSVRNSGKLTVKVKALTKSTGISFEARKSGKLLGTKSGLSIPAGASRTTKITLSARGRKALKGLKAATVSVRGSVPFGKPDSAARNLH